MPAQRVLLALTALLVLRPGVVQAQCVPTVRQVIASQSCMGGRPPMACNSPNGPLCQIDNWYVTFPDAWAPNPIPTLIGSGQYNFTYTCVPRSGICTLPQLTSCPPLYSYWTGNGQFEGIEDDYSVNLTQLLCAFTQYNAWADCVKGFETTYWVNHQCPPPVCTNPTFVCSSPGGIGYVNPVCVNGQWTCTNGGVQCSLPPPTGGCPSGYTLTCSAPANGWQCICQAGCGNCPILVDTQDQGFHLTDWERGVRFGFFPNSSPLRLSWTDASYANGWLALDRNGNGLIDDGTELFGNITPQPPSDDPNGFLALSIFDEPANGGNGNGVIDPGDAVYPHLRVWIDANHDGISQPDELKTLQELGIFRIDLKYHATPFVDQYGNRFRYRGSLWGDAGKGHEATYDVFLTREPQSK